MSGEQKKIAGKPLGGDRPAIHGALSKTQGTLRSATFQNIKPALRKEVKFCGFHSPAVESGVLIACRIGLPWPSVCAGLDCFEPPLTTAIPSHSIS